MKLQKSFRNHSNESVIFIRRVMIAFLGILFLTAILIINLYKLQIICFNNYQVKSNENRIKLIPIPPTRGVIYDRNGIQLALNRTIYQLEIMPAKVNNIQKTLNILRKIIDLNDNDINTFNKEYTHYPNFHYIPLKTNLTETQVARFAINQYRFSGVTIKTYKKRYYSYGSTLTHVIGYVSKINNKDIKYLDKNGKLSNYAGTKEIGKLGIERFYEDKLHGKTGYEEVEVNNRSHIVRHLKVTPPQAGYDIYLTLDLKLQQYIEKLLVGSRAAVVVTNPRNGDILALVSMPSYDANMFVNGITHKEYSNLINDPNMPLLNRAIQGLYPPASTVKPYIAISALSTGIITKTTSIFDPGWWKLPGSTKFYRDWKRLGHGYLNITKSIEESADTFFYQIAYNMGIDTLAKWMGKFSYGQYTGIDIIEESPGNMPTRQWKIKRFKEPWYQGDTISVGIGQGYWTATPLQMNKSLMILINNGNIKVPHLLQIAIKNNRKIPWVQLNQLSIKNIHPDFWKIVKDGMYGVANRPNGTAHKYFTGTPYKAAAKSGTAQVFSLRDNNKFYKKNKIAKYLRDHKLMVAFAPYDKPKIAVSIILENGGSGPDVGTIMRQILDRSIIMYKNKESSYE